MFSAIPQSLRIAPVLASFVAGLAGCGGQLSTASSIRVEVDVYKGPLSLELDTQWAELLGVVNEARDTFDHMVRSFASLSMPMKNCTEKKYEIYKSDVWQVGDMGMEARHCYFLYGIKNDLDVIKNIRDKMLANVTYPTESKAVPGPNSPTENTLRDQTKDDLLSCQNNNKSGNCSEIKKVLRNTSELAVRLKAKALLWSQLMLISQPDSYIVRVNMASFSSALAQYSNQLSSRSDALLKQIEGKPRQVLPTSVYLRDTSTTDFPNLHAWNRAAAPALLNEMLFHPLTAFSSVETFDRIRVIERLFADHYWTNINTVYGSGQGEVRMALIKDDIGNWDLKSFDSDPTELVDAYKDVTLAGLKAATGIAKEIAKNGLTAGGASALDLASRLARGQMGSGGVKAGSFNIEALHGRVVTRLQGLKQNVATRKQALDARKNTLTAQIDLKDEEIKKDEGQIQNLKAEVVRLETEQRESTDAAASNQLVSKRKELSEAWFAAAVRQEERSGLKKELDFTQEKLDTLPASIVREMQSLIEDHEAVIDVLQESVVAEPPKPQPGEKITPSLSKVIP